VELCIGEAGALGLDADEARCRAIATQAERSGVPVASVASGLYWAYALASEDPADRARAVAALERMIQITSWLGARTLLTIPGAVDVFFQPGGPVIPYDAVWERSVAGLTQVLPLAEDRGVTLGIENVWNKFLLTPLEMARFIDQFGSSAIGAYVDVANVLPYGYPEQWLRILGKRVAGIHFKDFRRAVGTIEGFVDLLEGDVDWPAVMQAIAEIGYRGPVVAEMIPLYRHFPETRIANTSRAMDAILGRTAAPDL
jgi:hexulose-6-phosphate isomerase